MKMDTPQRILNTISQSWLGIGLIASGYVSKQFIRAAIQVEMRIDTISQLTGTTREEVIVALIHYPGSAADLLEWVRRTGCLPELAEYAP